MTEYLICLPWPPTKTSPNASGQGKWRAKAEAGRSYKATCGWICKGQAVRPVGYPVAVDVTFCPPPRVSRYDLDNTLARAKQGLDAIAEAIGVDDAEWRSMHLYRGNKTKEGAILVHIKPETVAKIELRGTVS